jgi:hypothetical protein
MGPGYPNSCSGLHLLVCPKFSYVVDQCEKRVNKPHETLEEIQRVKKKSVVSLSDPF